MACIVMALYSSYGTSIPPAGQIGMYRCAVSTGVRYSKARGIYQRAVFICPRYLFVRGIQGRAVLTDLGSRAAPPYRRPSAPRARAVEAPPRCRALYRLYVGSMSALYRLDIGSISALHRHRRRHARWQRAYAVFKTTASAGSLPRRCVARAQRTSL